MNAEDATTCEHEWRWLPRPVSVVPPLGQLSGAFNVKCTRCGAHGWAHGTMPDARMVTVTLAPTTGRS